MQKIAISLLIAVVHIHAMEHNPNVRVEQHGNISSYQLDSVPVPQIRPGECEQCGKNASSRCSACRLAYYCSSVCQKLDWISVHKSVCEEMKQADHGDIAHMRNVFSAYLQKGLETLDKKYAKRALAWHLRTIIRMRQDIACSTDLSTSGGMGKVTFEHGMQIQELIKKNVCTKQELQDMNTDLTKNAIAWVDKRTQDGTLVPPYGIRRYGMGAFMNAQMNAEKEFLPQDQWQQKRAEVLSRYKQELQQQ